MNSRKVLLAACALTLTAQSSYADVLCKIKKTGQLIARPTVCTKKETPLASLSTTTTTTSAAADQTVGNNVSVQDTGAVATGSDSTVGLDVNVNRLNATGGNISTTGLNLSVIGDAGGDSTNVGLSVQTSGADTNYCALFQGGNVGIGVNDPDELLELAGRLHLGQSSAPGEASDKLYNINGTLYWSGQVVGLQSATDGKITAVNAGSGLAGGGSSGAVTLSVDSGTSAGKVVQLNSSAELPAVSGINLTALNGSNLSTGTVPDARLSSNVTTLGPSIGLSSEVTGTLPVANGGIGASSLSDLITLGTHTTGNYVGSATAGAGISVSGASGEGSAVSISVDSAFAPSWTGTHSFQSSTNFGTSTASTEMMHLNGRVHIEPSSAPTTTTDRLYNVGGALFFNGQNLSTTSAGGDITEIIAGTGLTGGATTGAATLSVDTGTGANDIVQLNGSGQLPALSGVNLTSLSASNISSGALADARLSANVSLLGPSISLATEVAGTLPVANGGIGATSLNDLIALTTHTTGNYVGGVAAGTGITVASGAAEGGTATVGLDQSIAPSWTNTHTFSGVTNDITTGTNENFAIMPNGTGRVGIGTNSPSALLDTVFSSIATTASSETGTEHNVTDTGIVSTGTDSLFGLDLNVARSGATGGTINSTGLDVTVASDTAGAGLSTATGLNVLVSGADTNYAALLNGGNVGIGTTTPTSLLHTLMSSTSTTAGSTIGNALITTDSGVVTTGTDVTSGLAVEVSRTGATGGTINSFGLDINVASDDAAAGASTNTGLNVLVSGADTNYAALLSGGNVGIGTTTPTSLLHTLMLSASTTAGSVVGNTLVTTDTGIVTTGTDTTTGLDVLVSRTGATGGTINTKGMTVTVAGDTAGTGAATITGLDVSVSGADSNIAATFSGGSVGVSTTTGVLADSDIPSGSMVIGNGALCVEAANDECATAARAAGTIYAEAGSVTGIDLAEDFPIRAGDTVLAGDIVIADSEIAEKCLERGINASGETICKRSEPGVVPFITRSRGDKSQNKRVLGVVSTQPGMTLGGFGREELIQYRKVPLALAGRVPVKVSDENGAIEVGDRVTTSSTPGVGMRADEGDLVVGIALEPFLAQSGTVVVLVK